MSRLAALLRPRSPGGRPFLATSLGLVTGKAAALAAGFLFWLLAARVADAPDVGLAAGAVSLVMLGTQVAIAGTGSAFILHHARTSDRRLLLDAAVSLVLLTSAVASALALVLVGVLSEGLAPVATRPAFAVLFVAMTVLGTLGILLDNVSVALERGTEVLVRNSAGGLLTAGVLLGAVLAGSGLDAVVLFGVWVLGNAATCSVGARQLHRQLDGYSYRPRLTRPLVGLLLRSGLPNQALTLVERAPNLLLPVVVTEVLSPELNAYWYVAWMMSWGVLVIPVSVGITLFARVAKDPTAAGSGVRTAAQTGALLGVVAAAGAALLGPLVLRLIGADYAEAGTAPLRLLVLAVLPVLVVQLYYAVCRSRSRVREAVAAGVVTGVAALVGTSLVAEDGGLAGMAVVWVLVQAAAAVWAGLRLRVLLSRPGTSTDAVVADPLTRPVA